MTREELEEALDDLLPGNYHLATVKGKLTIITSLVEDEFGELVDEDEVDEEEVFDGDEDPFVEEDEDDDE